MRSLFLASFLSLSALSAQSPLSTTFGGGTTLNGYPGAQTMYFDITVASPTGVYISQWDIRCQAIAPFVAPGTLSIFRTAAGSTNATLRTTPSAWQQVGSATIAAAGAPAPGVLASPFHLAPGTYGIAMHLANLQPVYFNPGTSTGPGFTTFSNAEMTIDCTAGVAQNSTPTAPIGGGVSAAPRVAGVTITYATAGHLTDFTVSPNSAPIDGFRGPSPQLLTFTDTSVTSDPGGLVLWEWDFNGDTVIDATTLVPTAQFSYATCGTFNVSVTSYDGTGPVTRTKTAFVVLDPVNAAFTYTKIGDPAVFQFTDTSTGATSWQWNLDGVPGIDSTAQNPFFGYPSGCAPVSVSLTAGNACFSDSETRQVVPEPFIETGIVTPLTNNAGSAGGAVYFDANVTNPDGIQVCSFAINVNDLLGGTPIQVTFWEKSGTSVGSQATIAAWTNRGAAFANASKRDQETLITLPSPVYLSPGLHGIALQITGAGHAYFGTGTNPAPGALSYTNSDVTLNLGTSLNVAFSGAPFTPRIFSGRINYRTGAQGSPAYYTFATGCAGTVGQVGNVATTLPVIGTNLQINFPNAPFGALVFYGFSNTLAGGSIPLPVDAGFLGAPGCPILIDPAVTGPLLIGTNPTWTEALPLSGTLIGIHFYTQAMSFELAGFNGLNGSLSNGSAGVIGS